jgi:hypothetical protein
VTEPAAAEIARAPHSIGARCFAGWSFEITTDDPATAEHLDRLFHTFDALTGAGDDTHTVTVWTADDEEEERLTIDGQVTAVETTRGRTTSTIVHALTRRMIDACDAIGIHAGGVVRDGVGLALPAQMESGKSTLTAGLVRAGFDYLTDEAVMLDWETQVVIPFPKPISLDPGSWFLFPELEPQADLPPGYKDIQWHVPPDAIRPDALGAPCRIRYIVFPKYTEGAATELTPLARAEATVELAKNTFRFNERPRRCLDTLAAAVREADCYRLTVGDLDIAVATITDLVEHGR